MMQVFVEGSLPLLPTDLHPITAEVANIMLEEVRRQFVVGGDPPWPHLATGGISNLYETGALFHGLTAEADGSEAIVRTSGEQPYDWIHNEGGTIIQEVNSYQRAFFFWKFKDTGDDKWLAMALSKTLNINIPKREYAAITEKMIDRILEFIPNKIIEFTNTHQEKFSYGG